MDQIVRHSDSDPDSAIAAHVQPGTRQTDPETIFSNIYDYPWDEDSEFQSGLSSILGSKEEPPSGGSTGGPTYHDRDLLLQAQCFYFTRKFNLPTSVDVAAYKSWISTQTRGEPACEPASINPHELLYDSPDKNPSNENTAAPPLSRNNKMSASVPSAPSLILPQTSTPTPTSTPEPAQPQSPPPYPTTFSSIVDLITRNQPIPGIEDIPDTVLDASLSAPNKTPWRRKPWEKEDDTGNVNGAAVPGNVKTVDGEEAKAKENKPGKEDQGIAHGCKRSSEAIPPQQRQEEESQQAAENKSPRQPHDEKKEFSHQDA